MKKFILLTQILLLSLLMACESDTPTLPSESKALAGNISTRSNTTETLGEGSRILLNARGGLTIENELFTYNNGAWSNENGHKWGSAEETTHITALYPHDATSPYNGDALKDFLISQATLTPGETNVSLIFKHLFASFTLNVDETLVDMISTIQLTTPQKIASISPTTGEITLTENTNTTTLTGNGSGSYTFIIPPMEASIELGITLTNGKSQTYTLQRHCFESGLVYECRLRDWNTVPGIRSAEDLIEFSQIYNKKKTGDLLKFGEMQADGRMLYRLLSDIDFNGKNILPIGYYNGPSVIFSDIFDGQGHTISNFMIPDKSINNNVYKNYAGLFGYIGPRGVVKNLHILNAKTTETTLCTYIGGIAAKNEGIINNCSVQDSNLQYSNSTNETGIRIGGICASMSNGKIINSHSTDNILSTSQSGAIGGIIGDSSGDIINCYTYGNSFTVPTNGYAGGIIGTVSTTNNINIANCYVMHTKTMLRWGAIIGLLQKNTITLDNVFYNGGDLINENKPLITPYVYKFQYSQFSFEEKHISVYLNEWIKITEKESKDSDFTFNYWIKSETPPYPALFKQIHYK